MTLLESDVCVRDVRAHGAGTLVVLCGEIDLLTAPGIAYRLDGLTRSGRPDLLIDLRPVSFCDWSGLRVLARAHERAGVRRGRVRLICTDPTILRILRHPLLRLGFEVLAELPPPTEA
jgi:anti-anti-sigma factor